MSSAACSAGDLAALDVGFVVRIPELVDTAHRHFSAVRGLFPRREMHEADRLHGFPEVARGLGRDTVAHFGDLLELGLADRVGALGGHLAGQVGMPLGEGDDGLEHDHDGLQQVPLAQGVGARTHLPEALGLHLLHLGLGQADDVVESVVEHVAVGLHHAAAEGAVALEQTAVGIFTDGATFEEHGMIEQKVEVLFAELVFQRGVHVVDRVHVFDPVLGVGLELLQVFRIDQRRGDVAQLAVEAAALAHGENLAGLHGAGDVVATDELGGRADDDLGVADQDGAVLKSLLERLRPAVVDRHGLGLFPGLGEQQGVVNVDLGSRVFPFLLQVLEAGGHDDRGFDFLCGLWVNRTGDNWNDGRWFRCHSVSLRECGPGIAMVSRLVPYTEQCSVLC